MMMETLEFVIEARPFDFSMIYVLSRNSVRRSAARPHSLNSCHGPGRKRWRRWQTWQRPFKTLNDLTEEETWCCSQYYIHTYTLIISDDVFSTISSLADLSAMMMVVHGSSALYCEASPWIILDRFICEKKTVKASGGWSCTVGQHLTFTRMPNLLNTTPPRVLISSLRMAIH